MTAMNHGRTGRCIGSAKIRGVTLIELLTAIVIVGILAAIAYPSYRNQMIRTNRADGKAELLNTAQLLERCFTRFNAYNNGGCAVAGTLAGAGVKSPNGWYVIKASGANLTATTYTLTATAQGSQANDSDCGNLTVNHKGERGATGTTPAVCW